MDRRNVAVEAEWQVFCHGASDSDRHLTEINWPRQQKLAVWCDEHGGGVEMDLAQLNKAIEKRERTVTLRVEGRCTEATPPYREHLTLVLATVTILYGPEAAP